ncbi:hypothetical protein OAN12_07590 [Halioglobus sp.]|nr:hypothetical protein [Halioglobus sp.]
MSASTNIPECVVEQSQLCQQRLSQATLWVFMLALALVAVWTMNAADLVPDSFPLEFSQIAILICMPVAAMLAMKIWRYIESKNYLQDYEKIAIKLEKAHRDSSAVNIQGVLSEANTLAKTNHLIPQVLDRTRPDLHSRLTELNQQYLTRELRDEYDKSETSCKRKIEETKQQVPLIRAKNQITTSLNFLSTRREEMQEQWDAAYEAFSWWNKIKYSDGPDFKEIDKAIAELSALQKKLAAKHSDDLKELDAYFKQSEKKALARIAAAKTSASRFIADSEFQDSLDSRLLQKGLWFSALSVPVSMWSDLDSVGNVYDSLRAVNSNFATMTDAEIWWESLFMPAESLAGLAALTKGAYFEQLVAQDTGGELFEHFNNPDTDIVIDGVAFQLKATDSVDYVYSVDESIPVIATTEVALATGVIDSGYTNEELANTVDKALGGAAVDIGDTTVDAILAGLGGLGFFATIEGINHASKKYSNGGDGVEALFEGAGVAIEGTARALVGAAEMTYNVLASRPSRFVGRALLRGLIKLDDKLMAPEKKD